jgi:mRNA interferase RelE/StbE
LRRIRGKRVLAELGRLIDDLARSAESLGKELEPPLDGIRSVHAVRDRYWVLYEVDRRARRVTVLLVGPRRPGRAGDVYQLAARLLRDLTS